jgi:hypothetical protein
MGSSSLWLEFKNCLDQIQEIKRTKQDEIDQSTVQELISKSQSLLKTLHQMDYVLSKEAILAKENALEKSKKAEIIDQVKEELTPEIEEEISAVEELENEIGSLINSHTSSVEPESKLDSDDSLGDKLRRAAISDLNSAIGISEKFLYMNELFEGDSGAYKACLDKLNTLSTFKEANDYLKSSVVAASGWSDDNEYVQKFYDVIERRYL